MQLLHALVAAAACCLPPAALGNTVPAGEDPQAPSIDPRKVFSKNCAWCHNNFGLEAGKGPKLAGTGMSAKQVYERIANGKSGAMPAYKKMLSHEEIQVLADYIKTLPGN